MMNSKTLIAAATALLIAAAMPAWTVDGCRFLLCLAGPWQGIPGCVSEVERLFQDLSSGDPFPSCSFANRASYSPNSLNAPAVGSANAPNTWPTQWEPAPDPNCPPQYRTRLNEIGWTMYGCRYVGMIPVRVDGQLWSRTYWSTGGGSVTELSASAPSVFGVRGARGLGDLQAYQVAQAAADAAAAAAAQASGGGGG
jgi:hypothetical protein